MIQRVGLGVSLDQELQAMKDKAFRAGYEAGYERGFKAGDRNGRAEGAEAMRQAIWRQFQALASQGAND